MHSLHKIICEIIGIERSDRGQKTRLQSLLRRTCQAISQWESSNTCRGEHALLRGGMRRHEGFVYSVRED